MIESALVANYVAAATVLAYAAWIAEAPLITARRAIAAIVATASGWNVLQSANAVDVDDSKGIYQYYMKLWKYFYFAYLWLPFVR